MVVCLSVQVEVNTIFFLCQAFKNKLYPFFYRIDPLPEFPPLLCQMDFILKSQTARD